MLETSWRLGARSMSPLATPLIIPQALWVAGLAMFLLIAGLLLLRALGALLTGDTATAQRLIGSRSLAEELEAEIEEQERARLRAPELGP